MKIQAINTMYLLLASGLCLLGASACATKAVPIARQATMKEAENLRETFKSAGSIVIYEGLPHQTKERELMESEAAKQKITRILGYPFYTPAVPAKDRGALQKILGDDKSYGIYTGPKTCGGFHPDYDLSWNAGGGTNHVQICFGCGEALFTDGRQLLPYDIKHRPLAELKALLAKHALKRPKS